MTPTHLQLDEQDLNELASFFDLLAKFDYEDVQKHQVISQEIEKGFSLSGGEPLLESCEQTVS